MAHIQKHNLGSTFDHDSCTLAELNTLINDGTVAASSLTVSQQTGSFSHISANTWTNVSNGFAVTAPAAGYYRVTANFPLRLYPTDSSEINCWMRFHDGTSVVGSNQNMESDKATTSYADNNCVMFSTFATLAKDDVVNLQLRTNKMLSYNNIVYYSAGWSQGYISLELMPT